MGEPEFSAFLSHLAVDRNVAASTQNQALSAIRFLYEHVLCHDPEWLTDVARAKRPRRLPVVLSREEVGRVSSIRSEAAPNFGSVLDSGKHRSRSS